MAEITGLSQMNPTMQVQHLDIDSNNNLKELSPLHKMGRNIADAFRSLSDSGRSKISARTEAVMAKIETFAKPRGNLAEMRKAGDVLKEIRSQSESIKAKILNQSTASQESKIADRFGKNSKEMRILNNMKQVAVIGSFARGLANTKFAASAMLDRSDRTIHFDAKSSESIKKEFKAELAKNGGVAVKSNMSNVFLHDASRGMTTQIGDEAMVKDGDFAVYEEKLRDFVGEEHKDYIGALSFISSQGGIGAIVAEQGYHADGFDFNSGNAMNMVQIRRDGVVTDIKLSQDSDNFYVRCNCSQNHTLDESPQVTADAIKFRNEGLTVITIPKGQVAPEGDVRFLPDFSVHSECTVRIDS